MERSVTPNAGNANNARNVNTDGSLNNNNAYNGNNGVRPDLVENGTDYGGKPENRVSPTKEIVSFRRAATVPSVNT